MEHTSHNYRLDVVYELPAHRPGLCRKPSPLKKKKTVTTTTKDSLCKEF